MTYLNLKPMVTRDLIIENIPLLKDTSNPIEGWYAYNGEELLGVIGAELFQSDGTVILHVDMVKNKRTPKRINGFIWLIKQVIYPLFKARGYRRCIGDCSANNIVIQKFMVKCGCVLHHTVIAEHIL